MDVLKHLGTLTVVAVAAVWAVFAALTRDADPHPGSAAE